MIVNGKNLKLLIDAPYSFVGNWSVFGLAYSIKKFLPEAEICLIKRKSLNADEHYFTWIEKMKIKTVCNNPSLVLPSTCMIIRPIDSDEIVSMDMVSEVKQDKFTPFVSYKEGCARFVMSDWINSNEYPFPYADRLAEEGMCPNETQVLKLWKQMNALYPMMVKG